MPQSLYLRVVVALTLALVATAAPFGWLSARGQERRYVEGMRGRAAIVARSLAENSAHFLVIADYAGLEHLLLDGARLPSISSIHLFEPDGTMLAHIHRDAESAEPRVHYTREAHTPPERLEPRVEVQSDRLVVWEPIVAGRLLGWLETTYGLDEVAAVGRSIWRQTLLLAGAWIAISVLVVTLTLRRPMLAIRQLSRFAHDLPGRKGERLGMAPMRNEIGLLAASLDGASVELAETERRQRELETQLRHAQRMEVVGQLASGIAHDFNNVLTGIFGYATLLLDAIPKTDARREAAEEVVQAARRASTLTRGLLAFSRKSTATLAPTDLNEVIRGVERLLKRIIGEEVVVRTELSADPLVVNADSAQLEQVLMNLATNARDAMPRGGALTIATSRVELVEPVQSAKGQPLQGACAQLEVVDTGAGMDPQTLARAWEPFFTTKGPGCGTGLGLPIVLGIVEQHGGAIQVESRPFAGTTFRMQFPLAEGAQPHDAAREEEAPRGKGERILLVEDEAMVRHVARSILEGGGYRVVEAVNGSDALEHVLHADDPVQLVISDAVMPRMGGRELRDALRARRPGLPFLLFSGYSAEVLRGRERVEDTAEVLPKPFASRELLARVRALLDRAGPG